jgi:hypothetical protein
VRTNPRIRRSLITYLGAAALVLIVVSVGAVLVGRQVAQDEALRDAERLAQRTANLVVAPLLADVLAGDASRGPSWTAPSRTASATAPSPSSTSGTAPAR